MENGEMIGIGAANVAAGFFQGFPVSTSGSRTAVAEQAGAKTQLTGVVGAAAIVVMLVLAPGLLKNLPNPTLAAVVIAASLSLADLPGTVRLWRQRRAEFVLSITAFLGVALLGVLQGIAVAVALSILNVFRRAWWPYETTLGRLPGMPGQHDRQLHPEAEEIPGLVIYRFDAPLFFANARTFRDQIRRFAAADPRPKWIVIAAEPITDVDTTAADMLADLDEELNAERHFPRVRRTQGPRARQARALRADRSARPGPLLPNARRRGRGLPRANRRGLDATHKARREPGRERGALSQRPRETADGRVHADSAGADGGDLVCVAREHASFARVWAACRLCRERLRSPLSPPSGGRSTPRPKGRAWSLPTSRWAMHF